MSLIFFGGLGSTSAIVLPGMFSSSHCVFSFSFVDLTPWRCFFIWPFWVLSESGKCFQTANVVRLDHVMKFHDLIVSIHVSLTGNPAAAWRYVVVCGIDGKLYTLFASSLIWYFGLLTPSIIFLDYFCTVGELEVCCLWWYVYLVCECLFWMEYCGVPSFWHFVYTQKWLFKSWWYVSFSHCIQ